MAAVLDQLQALFPTLRFTPGDIFVWSPETREVIYKKSITSEPSGVWSLLHETSHALLEHKSYDTDFELLQLEVAAWEEAQKLAARLGITIDEDHIQDCLDTYRDWIYARSICPKCTTKSIQQADLRHYRCFNCHETWQVTPSRFCRAYRATKRRPAVKPPQFDALVTI